MLCPYIMHMESFYTENDTRFTEQRCYTFRFARIAEMQN